MVDVNDMRSRYTGTFVYLDKSVEQVEAMDAVREDVDATALGEEGNAFAYDAEFLNYE